MKVHCGGLERSIVLAFWATSILACLRLGVRFSVLILVEGGCFGSGVCKDDLAVPSRQRGEV